MSYNGYKNWTQWNVSLWINNDEGLYRMAQSYLHRFKNKPLASIQMYSDLKDMDCLETPDGAKYSVSAIRAAMVGM